MKFEHLLQRLHGSKAYEDFEKKHKDSFVIAGFFVLDLEGKQNLEQIDYYVPSENKIAAFTLGSPVTMQMLDMIKSETKPQPISTVTSTDLDALSGILDDEMKNRGISEKIKKIVAILHVMDGKPTWNLSCILSGMGILKAHVEDSSQTVLKMEKSNLFDIMQKMPAAQLKQMQQMQQAQGGADAAADAEEGEKKPEPTPAAPAPAQSNNQAEQAHGIDAKKLEEVAAQIEKEKAALEAALEKEKQAAMKEEETKKKQEKPAKKAKKK